LDDFAATGVHPVAFLLPVSGNLGHHHTTMIGGFLFLSHNPSPNKSHTPCLKNNWDVRRIILKPA
jgi:hypothetical protein